MCYAWSVSIGCLLSFAALATAQDSGPGPSGSATSKQYSLTLVDGNGMQEGTMIFARSTNANGGSGTGIDQGTGALPGTTEGAGNDPTNTTNPTASGDFGNVGNPSGTMTGTVAGNSSGSTTNPSANGTTTTPTNTSGTTTNPGTTTATGTTSDPPSYWTSARANGKVASRTSDPNSSDYWTSARARGEVAPGDSTGSVSSGGNSSTSIFSSGTFLAELGADGTAGSWYAVDLGGFSLWYAASDSGDSSTTFVGYATPEVIVGRASQSNGGVMEAMFSGSFFYGTATDNSDPSQMISSDQ